MNHPSLRDWLALWHTPGVGPRTFQRLLTHFPDLSVLFKAKERHWQALGLSEPVRLALRHPNWAKADRALSWAQSGQGQILTWCDEDYPALLKEIVVAPPLLYARGNTRLLAKAHFSMVGSRNPTAYGAKNARCFASALAQEGMVITSGLALGIDACSHEGALAVNGETCAILGTGVDQIYPRRHANLAERILLQEGLLLSEFSLGTPARAAHFPRRNRLISGLSWGTLVVEAALRSGSLITARYALEQNREVFAIPGLIHNPLSRGCHALIAQGAICVSEPADILGEIKKNGLFFNHENLPDFLPKELDSAQQKLVQCIGDVPTPIEDLVQGAQSTVEQVLANLTILELKGYVQATASGFIRGQ